MTCPVFYNAYKMTCPSCLLNANAYFFNGYKITLPFTNTVKC